MTLKSLIIAAAMATTPGLAFAMGCSSDHVVMSCAAGSIWDVEKQRCITATG
ncbi:hypothetical protein [Shimia haliotis]|uniref:Chitin binding Peritrophin-A domain-containing protein n=1 Tax=Shimia haliotis TaxID=1280847 RepID=A0A1I4BFK1_9RHOB|nr:hypothetical protein [Shimia haliotis]SFK67652.1 hypothetical protein SAMN04488036_1011015 [Shimia haliotis]